MKNMFSRKIKESEKDVKFVGAYVPLPIVAYLELYVTAKGLSKTNEIIACLEKWKERQSKINSEDALIAIIVKKVLLLWTERNNTLSHTKGFGSFCMTVRAELVKRKIENEIIEKIIKRIKNEAKK